MEATANAKPVSFNRWLPYWAVLQADVHQTLRSWVYRVWVLASVLASVGYLLYRVGLAHEAGIVQPASGLISDLLRLTALGSIALIVVLTTGTISAERGTMADSVLSRGISRHQYFLGKWHSRLFSVLTTFLVLGAGLLLASLLLLHEDLKFNGSALALLTVAALLAVVVTCGVTVSAICNNTLLGIAILWVLLYGGGFALTLLPTRVATPQRFLNRLPFILRGCYFSDDITQLISGAAILSFVVAGVGLAYFSRRDI